MQPTLATENHNTKYRSDSNSTKQVKLHFLPTTQPQFYKENTVSSKLGRFLMYSNEQTCHIKVKISNVYFDIRKWQDGTSNFQNFKNNHKIKFGSDLRIQNWQTNDLGYLIKNQQWKLL